MSLRVTWDGTPPNGEPMDVVMEDCTSWAPANTVLKAGRELSSWFFKRPSTQRRPSLFTLCYSPQEREFYHTDSPMDLDFSKQPISINDLPREIMEEIFIIYVNTPDLDDSYLLQEIPRYRVSSRIDSSSNPILLGQVCSTWRVVTQSLPTLWSKISASRPLSQDIPLFSLWLERSGQISLDLTLVDRFTATEDSTAAIQDIFRLALTQSHRWNAVTLDLATDMGNLLAFEHPPSTPSLHSFDIRVGKWSDSSLRLLLDLLYSSPSLRQVSCNMPSSNTIISAISQTPEPLFQNITHLQLGDITGEGLSHLLGRYTSLVSLSLRISKPLMRQHPITLPTLRCLHIDHGHDIITLLHSLHLPSLTHLTLPNGFVSPISPKLKTMEGWDALLGLLERSSSTVKLESLSFDASGVDESIIVQVLASPSLDSLKSLSIRSKVTDHLVTALTLSRRAENSGLLLKLERLELRSCSSSDGRLSELIISRGGSLKHAKVILRGSQSFDRDLALQLPGVEIIF